MQIEVLNIQKSYGKKQVLKGVSFSAESGMCVGIVGANGCGKSTLLGILAGVFPAGGGQFLCDGENLFASPSRHARTVGYVPQGAPLFEELSAQDNLRLWYTPAEMRASLSDGVLALLGIDEFLRVPVRKLSGGMKKRLSIGCAVAAHPQILLCDEWSAALDLPCRERITAYFAHFCKNGGILAVVTHDPTELAACDALYVLRDGVLHPYVYDGDSRRLCEVL